MNIVNIIPAQEGEKISAMIRMRNFEDMTSGGEGYLVFITRNGTVKRMEMSVLKNIRNTGIRAITLDEDDELISVRSTDGTQRILIATHDGMAICFDETDLRPMGRTAVGVRGIRLRSGDYCVGAARASESGAVLTVTENGYGKRTPITDYLRGADGEKSAQSRGGMGLKNYKVTEKTGKVAGVKVVEDTDDVLIISDDGTIIRMSAADISIFGRSTMGVRLMRVGEDTRVISVARIEETPEEESEGEDTAGAEVQE